MRVVKWRYWLMSLFSRSIFVFVLAAFQSGVAWADDDFDRMFTKIYLDRLFMDSSICRGGSMFWHIVAVFRINGYSQEDVLKMRDSPDESLMPTFTTLLRDFYAIPQKNLFDYLVKQHGMCMEGALHIPQQKAARCYRQYLQPYFFKLYGPNPAPKPLDPKIMFEVDGEYLACLKSNGGEAP